MEKNIFCTILYHYSFKHFCFLFCIYIGVSRENFINKSNKYKKKLYIYPLTSGLGENNKLEYNNRKKEKYKTSDLLHEKKYNENNNININNENVSGLLKQKSQVILKNDNSTTIPSFFAYIKENNLHKYNSRRNSNSNTTRGSYNNDNNDSNNNDRSEGGNPEDLSTSGNSFIQNDNEKKVEDSLDYVEVIGERGSVIFSQESYYVNLYTYKEILRFTNHQPLTDSNMNTIEDEKLKKIYDQVQGTLKLCESKKIKLLNAINDLENPKESREKEVPNAQNYSSYNTLKNDFLECLRNYDSEIKKKIKEVTKNIEENYGDKYCTRTCNANVYFENINFYISYLNNNSNNLYNSYYNKANDFLTSSISMIKLIENELGNNETINSVNFVQREIKEIIKSYGYHMKNIKNSMENIKKLENINKSTTFDRNNLIDKSVELAKLMSQYNFSNEIFNKMRKWYSIKKNIFQKLFITLAEKLERKMNEYVTLGNFQNVYDSIMVDWKYILEYTQDIYNRNSKGVKNYEKNGDIEVIIIKNKVKEKLTSLEEINDKLNNIFSAINSKYILIKSTKSLIGEIKDDFRNEVYKEDNVDGVIKIMETLSTKHKTIKDNVNTIYSNYANIKKLEQQVNEINDSINGYLEEIKSLQEKGSKNDIIREEIITKMAYITENIRNLKKVLSVEEKSKEYIAQVDELIKGTTLNISKYIDKKNNAQNKIKAIIEDIYNGSLKDFAEELSLNVDNNRSYLTHTHHTGELNGVLEKTREDYEKLKALKHHNFSDIINNLNNEIKVILEFKDDILRIQNEDMDEKLTNSLEHFKTVYKILTTSLNDYKVHKEKLEEYKTTMIKREKHFVDNLFENDDNVVEGKSTYKEFQVLVIELKKRNKIHEEFYTTKDALKKTKIQLLLCADLEEKLKSFQSKKNTDFKEFTDEINNGIMDKKLSDYENEFIKDNESTDKTIQNIETSNKNINHLKVLNAAIKNCTNERKLIESLIEKKNRLKEKVVQEYNKLDEDNIIEEHINLKLKVNLNKAILSIETKIYDTSMNNMKEQIKNMLESYTNLKKNYKDFNETELKKLKENSEWKSIKDIMNDLNAHYEILKQIVDDIIINHNNEYMIWIDNSIIANNEQINNKIKENLNTLEQMMEKLKIPYFNIDASNFKYNLNQENINEFKTNVDNLIEKINIRKDKLNSIKAASDEQLTKKYNVDIGEMEPNNKKNALKEIYDIIIRKSNELSVLLKDTSILRDIENTELNYYKVLIADIVKKITDKTFEAERILQELNYYVDVTKLIKNYIYDAVKDDHIFNYREYSEEGKKNYNNIKTLFDESIRFKSEVDRGGKIDEAKDIEGKLHHNLQEVTKNYNSLKDASLDIKNMKELLSVHDIQSILHNSDNHTEEVEKYAKLIKDELEKSDNLIKQVKTYFDNAEKLKKEINTSLSDEKIEANMKEIIRCTSEIAKRKDNMNSHILKAKEYKEKALLHFRNASRREIIIKFFKENKNHGTYSVQDSDMNKATEDKAKCEEFSKETVSNEEKIKNHGTDFMEFEKKSNTLLSESLIFEIKTKYAKGKIKEVNIMSDIEQIHSYSEKKLNECVKKLENFKEISKIEEMKDNLKNDKSYEAYRNIKLILELAKHNLSSIEDVKQSIKNILIKANGSKNYISETPKIQAGTSLDLLKIEHDYYLEHIVNIENLKKFLHDEKNKVDVIYATTTKMENDLEKYKKVYEVVILEKIKEIADEKKRQTESTRESINTLKDYFTSIINEFNLKQNIIMEILEDGQNTMNQIYEDSNKSYILIESYVKKAVNDNVKYGETNRLRKEAEKEEVILKNKANDAKNNMINIKKNESFKLLNVMKDELDKVNIKCEEEHSKVKESHDFIKRTTDNIKKTYDENSSLDILKQAIDKNNEIKKKIHSCYKAEAQNVFGKMIKTANLIGIKVISGMDTEITPEEHLQITSKLNSNLKYESEIEMESNVYKSMDISYSTVLKIFKNAEDIDNKLEESEMWIRQGKNICYKSKSTNELNNKFTLTSNKGSIVLYKILDAFNKFNELKELSCDDKYQDIISEKTEYEKLAKLSSTYNEKKSKSPKESDIIKIKEELNNSLKTLNNLEEQIEMMKEQETSIVSALEENSSVVDIDKKINDIDTRITEIVSSYDELLVIGKQCKVLWYDSLVGNLNSKTSNYLRIIQNQREYAELYVVYIRKNSDSMNSDIRKLNNSYDGNRINNYTLTNVEEVIKHYNNLKIQEKEATGIIIDIKKKLVDVNEEVNINSLINSKKEVLKYYDKLKEKVTVINEIYKEINLAKLKEMELSSDKYFEIGEIFSNMVEKQSAKLSDNKNKLKDIEKIIKEKEKELRHIGYEYELGSIQRFNLTYKNIVDNMQKLYAVEEDNSNEDKKLKTYIENILYLIKRTNSLLADVNDFENDNNKIKENEDITNDAKDYIIKVKEKLKNTIVAFERVLENIRNNRTYSKNNDDIKNIIYDSWKNVSNIKEKYSMNLVENDNLFHIEDYLNNIKSSITNGINEDNIDEYINKMSEHIENELKSIKNKENKEEIKKRSKNILNYYEEAKEKLQTMNNIVERVTNIKEDINNIFSVYSINMNNSVYVSTKRYIEEAEIIINNLHSYIDKMKKFTNNNGKKIKQMEDELNKKGFKDIISDLNIDKISHQSTDTLIDNSEDTENKSANHHMLSNVKNYDYSALHELQRLANNTNYENFDSANENERFRYKNNARGWKAGEKFTYAGAIALGLLICSGAGFVVVNGKFDYDNVEEADFKTREEHHEYVNELNIRDEEIIEVSFDENNYHYYE
ncbi:reticulocyte binding protein 3, putative [Plasmodium malariae]|uniref:Reticulocyte binding protein 3, putative n=1 Tax=Plasmodium malariae TaxID=5858 RepID=A0A1D3TFV2_PLAMA|nr:reticulocyte binding protein 3, putative [Plasmodium malariae]SCP03793.1 reticulocyte binding protein 3, putative [Plasmodium malariae]